MTTTSTTIEITPNAATKVRELLEESGKTDHALRIFVRGMSCSGPAYGMALDNLLSVQLVTADGRVVQASAQETRICSGPFVAVAGEISV